MTVLVNLTAEERRLVRQYGIVRRRVQPEIEVGEDVGLVDEGADDALTSWLDKYPNLTATDGFKENIPQLVEQLGLALAGLPPMPRGSLSGEQAAALKEVFEPVRRAELVVQQYLYAVAALRSVVATATDEEDMSPVDAYALVGEIMKSPAYTNFDRIKVKLTRQTAAGKKKIAEYNAKPESIGKRATWLKKKRQEDPKYKARENARRRAKYEEKTSFKAMVTEMLASIDREHAEPQGVVR